MWPISSTVTRRSDSWRSPPFGIVSVNVSPTLTVIRRPGRGRRDPLAQRFWAKGSRLPRPGRRMTVRVGETFTLTMPKGGDRHESLRLVTVELMGHIAALLPPEQRGVYADAVK